MEAVSKHENMHVLSELDMITTKFVALEQEIHRLEDLQQVSTEKTPQYEGLPQWVHQLETTTLSLRK